MDDRLEDYFATGPWRDVLLRIRTILLSEGLAEEVKWGQPCYTAHGGNIAILHRSSDNAGVGFFKGVLLSDPEGILEPPGPNSRQSRVLRITEPGGLDRVEAALRRVVAEAVALERQGATVDLPKDDIVLPEELVEALAEDDALSAAFAALTPGRQRGFAIVIGGAKKPDTRRARIEKHRERILQGKGIHDR